MTLDELTTPLTRAEVEAEIYAALAAEGVSTTSWLPGAVMRTIITAIAIILSAFSHLTAAIARSGFLARSEGAWLTLVARHVYGVERIAGTFASGTVILNNAAGGIFNLDAGDLIVRHGVSGKTYRSTEALSLGSGETGVVIAVEAMESGSDSTASPNTIDAFETPLIGVTVNNPTAIVGLDEESDEALRIRCRAKLGSLSPAGPPDAYQFAVLSATTSEGAPAGATRVALQADGTGGVDVYVATASGPLTGSLGDASTPLGAVSSAVQGMVPFAITARVSNAPVVEVDVEYSLWVRASVGRTVDELRQSIATRISHYLGTMPIGGLSRPGLPNRVFREGLEAVIAEEVGALNVIDLEVTAPGLGVSLAANAAPVLRGTTTGTIEIGG